MKLLIGVTGSIAAIKIPDLIHKLTQLNHSCKVIITQDGLNFVTLLALSSMGADVYVDEETKNYKFSNVMEHINLAKWADKIIIAPVSANTLAKISCGFADNLLTSTILASSVKPIFIPAMNQGMWNNVITQNNVNKLKQLGYIFWGPIFGLQACGDSGEGRMLEVDEILSNIKLLNIDNQLLNGKKIVITGGGTIEAIDPVRYITNRSSGKMANALVEMAHYYGAQVIYICGKVEDKLPVLSNVTVINVKSADEMFKVAMSEGKTADVFIGCAAVCDYKLKQVYKQKIKKLSDSIILELVQNKDIIANIKKKYPKLFVIGFAAETENLINYALDKLHNKNLDMIIANDVSKNVFGNNQNQIIIIDKTLKQQEFPQMNKLDIAAEILKKIIDT